MVETPRWQVRQQALPQPNGAMTCATGCVPLYPMWRHRRRMGRRVAAGSAPPAQPGAPAARICGPMSPTDFTPVSTIAVRMSFSKIASRFATPAAPPTASA